MTRIKSLDFGKKGERKKDQIGRVGYIHRVHKRKPKNGHYHINLAGKRWVNKRKEKSMETEEKSGDYWYIDKSGHRVRIKV